MPPNRLLSFHYGLTIFLGAFLLFQVQPIAGKMILPWFGGSASVWTTCMLFFQVLLLLGYLYCHWIVRHLSPRAQGFIHISLLAASLLLLPLGLDPSWRPTGTEDPTLRIIVLLAFGVGLPYFALATTGPLTQAWFAREQPAAVPYRLFALSNLGSLLALLGYPVAVEPLLPTRWQAWLWSGLFAGFAVACGLLAWRGSRRADLPPAPRSYQLPPGPGARLAWVALAACPSILLLAVTSHLTENIAPIPLLWIAPLALYLISFILCFERRAFYRPGLFRPLLAVALVAMALLPGLPLDWVPVLAGTAIHLAAFFIVCMVCHGELARRQPHPEHLTSYYLMLALGGALGGLFVGLVAPYWFDSNYEFSIGLVLAAVLGWTLARDGEPAPAGARRFLGPGIAACFILGIAGIRISHHWQEAGSAEVTARNFYGTLSIRTVGQGDDAYRSLTHGRILHGQQLTAPGRQGQPTSYYGLESGAGRALMARGARGPLRVGIIGLGVGTLASYGRPRDYFRLYDINPLVVDIARNRFTYLSRTEARTELVLGDARLAMEQEPPQAFDILVVDAFSGDAVPVHLLTREAFRLYFRHLKPDGVLAVHVSNRFLDLGRVVKAAAASLDLPAALVSAEADRERRVAPSHWVLVSADREFFSEEGIREAVADIPVPPDFQAWRDDYSSLLAVLR